MSDSNILLGMPGMSKSAVIARAQEHFARADECGPSGWPESTPAQRTHAVRMLSQSILAHCRSLRSRKRADIATRPATQAKIDELRAHVARLKD